ncbi:hypothetical protein MKW94_003371 [Papaver nudicaule]|uniref:SHSP domain-containing protein n=1 Tax=Papaver nudicaule TaxID=74823 RepID=A0AA41VVL9_PAPNU|nr:hypothetical protein [Papaver nudicaule]
MASIIFSRKPVKKSTTSKVLKNSSPNRSVVSVVNPFSESFLPDFFHTLLKNSKEHAASSRSEASSDPYLSSDLFYDMESIPYEVLKDLFHGEGRQEENKMIKSSCSKKENKMKIWNAEENEGGVDLKINMPGFGKDDVQVTLEEKTLFIKGKEENAVNPISFELDLDIFKVNEMKAEMKNGVMKIFIPKVVEEKKEKNVVQVQIE